jgi:hypothetical protein
MIPKFSIAEADDEAERWVKYQLKKVQGGYEGQWYVVEKLMYMAHPPSLWLRVRLLNDALTK